MQTSLHVNIINMHVNADIITWNIINMHVNADIITWKYH